MNDKARSCLKHLQETIVNGTRLSRRSYVSTIPIVDFRIETQGGRNFSVWVRRKAAPAIVTILFCAALILLVPFAFLHSFFTSHPSHAAAGHSSGIPVCLMPFLVVFVGLALYRAVRGEIAQIQGLGGEEQWSFAQGQIEPPADVTGWQVPPLLAEGGLRACLNVTGGRWVIDFAAPTRNLYLGPFNTRALALRCEAELRRLRPGWFTDSADIAVLNGVLGETRINGYRAPPEPIVWFKLAALFDGGGCLLELRRQHGPRPVLGILALWLCGWAAGEFFVGWTILASLSSIRPLGGHRDPWSAGLFLLAWILLWTLFGFGALSVLVLGLKRTETWRFTHTGIIAGRSWHWWAKRRLPIDKTVQVRFGPFAEPPSVDFIADGLLLHLGPFATWDLAGTAMGDVERQFPNWQWPSTTS